MADNYQRMDRPALNAELEKRDQNPTDYGNIDDARARLRELDAEAAAANAAADAEDDAEEPSGTIKVRAGRKAAANQVILYEAAAEHPDGEVFLWNNPKKKGQTWTVGNTAAVQERIADQRLRTA